MHGLIDNAEIVLFDVFDTAIFRKVNHPTDVFDLLGKGIKAKRVYAEYCAAQLNPNTTLDFIYSNSIDLSKDLKDKEIELEYQLCYQNPAIYSVYQYVIRQNKKVGFVSDMYLPSGVIRRMLQKCGYDKIDYLFVSCEHNSQKSNGELYKKILQELKTDPSKLLIIGDNEQSDYTQAKLNGLSAYHYQRYYSNEDFWRNLGYNQIGCTIYSFIEWLRGQFKEKRIEEAYFLSREGLLFKKVYDLVKTEVDPSSHYLELSRKTVHFPLLADITEQEFWNNPEYEYIKWYMANLSSETVPAFFEYWDLDYRDYLFELEYEKINLQQDLSVLTLDDRVNLITKLTRLAFKDIQKQAVNAKERSLKYLLSNVDFTKKIAIIDIGWGGTLQESIIRLLGHNENIYGFYYGASNRIDERKEKYNIDVFQYKTDVVMNNYMIIEFLFSAEHGSVMGYDDNLKPVYNNDIKIEHRFIHDGVLGFTEDVKCMNIENHNNYGLLKMSRLLNQPTLEESVKIGNLSNFDGSDKAEIFIAKPDLGFLKKQYDMALNKQMFNIRLRHELASLSL